MSFNIKLFLFVLIATPAAWFVAYTAVTSTGQMAETFTVSRPPVASEPTAETESVNAPIPEYEDSTEQTTLERGSSKSNAEATVADNESENAHAFVRTFELEYTLPANSNCVLSGDTLPTAGILYKSSTYIIKGESLASIDKLIALYKKCDGGKLTVLRNEFDADDPDVRLVQRRQDEIKYYLLQRRIDKNDMNFLDNL